ncbi:MAG: LLM class flavin-dependent oxidoreductase [Halobacteriaceae archaeon]
MALEVHYKEPGVYVEPREGIEIAKRAVGAGFEGVWTGDHFLPWLDTYDHTQHVLPWFGALMNEVPEVTVGPSVTCPMLRYRPPLLAQAVATLDNMYPGRFELGVGTGEAVNEAFFLDGGWPDWSTRAEMLLEALEVMDLLWDGDGFVSYRGEHFRYEDVKLYTRPKEEVPVLWSALGPRSCRLAGEFADGLLTIPGPEVETVADRVVENYRRGLERAGKAPSEGQITVQISANVGDPERYVEAVRENAWLLPLDTEMGNPDPRDIRRVAERRLAETSDRELLDLYNVTDDPEVLVDLFDRYDDSPVDRVIVEPLGADVEDTVAAFEDHVLGRY